MEKRESWNTKIGFILSSIGSAVGLGNIWRFPSVVAGNGGGIFILAYLLAIVVVGLPAMIAEFALGRRAKADVVSSFSKVRPKAPKWKAVGFLGLLSSFAVLSFYAVISGWILVYLLGSFSGRLITQDSIVLISNYQNMVGNPFITLGAQAIFMTVTSMVVAKGVSKGIEALNFVLMPSIALILIFLLIPVLSLPGALEGMKWFYSLNFEAFSLKGVLEALGQVFFSLSLGMGTILTYGSYLNKEADIPKSALIITLADLGVALLAGMIVIPSLFAFGMPLESGPGLVFMTLPGIFSRFRGGFVWAGFFFIMLFFAALSSAISILETAVSYFIGAKGWTRKKGAIFAGVLAFVLGVPSALSQNLLSETRIRGLDVLGFVDFFTSNVALILSGLLTVFFVGWVWGTEDALKELRQGSQFQYEKVWVFALKFITPVVIAYVFQRGLR